MNNFSDLLGGDALSSGNLLNDLSQQIQELGVSQADPLQDQTFGIEDSEFSSLFGADGGLMGSHLGADHQGMAQGTDADWANLSHLADGSGALGGMQGHGLGLVGGLDLSTSMEADHHRMPQVTDTDWANLTNLDGRLGADLTTPFSAQDMANNPSHRRFGCDPVSSVPKIDDMSMNKWGWVYKDNNKIGKIKDGKVYDFHGNYAGYFNVSGEVYTPEGTLLGQVSPNGDEYDPEGHNIGHIEGQYPIPKGAADMLLIRVPQQW